MTKVEIKKPSKYPKYLVIGGGGIKGFTIPGVLMILHKWGYLKRIKGIAGASVGALIGGLLVLGYHPNEIAKLCFEQDISMFSNRVDMIKNWKSSGYCISKEIIINEIKKVIKRKGFHENITLLELYNLNGIEFVCASTRNSFEENLVYISYKNYPQMPFYQSILMSMSIPILMESPEWEGFQYYDGGFLDNYPVSYFHSVDPDGLILGIRLSPRLKVTNNDIERKSDKDATKGFFGKNIKFIQEFFKNIAFFSDFKKTSNKNMKFMQKIFISMINEMEKLRNKGITLYEIDIDSKGIGTMSFNITHEQKKKLQLHGIEKGYYFVNQPDSCLFTYE